VKADWREKTIGEVIARIETVDPTKKPSETFSYVDVSSVSNETFEIVQTSEIQGANAPSRARRLIRTSDVIFATVRPTLKRIATVPPSLDQQICSTGYIVLRPSASLNHRFLFHYLFSNRFQSAMEQLQSGASYPAVTDGQVRQQPIHLPPLQEQQRIIAVLDEAFDGLARARAHTEANLQNARELFDSIKADALAYTGSDGKKVLLGDVADITSGLVDPRTAPYIDMLHIGAGNMLTGTDELADVRTAQEEKLISGKYLFNEKAVLYSKIRPYLRKAARPNFKGLCSADVYPLTPKKGVLDRDFLFHLLLGSDFTKYAISGSDRAGMPKVNQSHLFAYSFQLPPLEAQKRIASIIDEAHISCSALVELADARLSDIGHLRQSLLQQALAGELT
jgi:type I restriction enzyme S subunit